MCKSFDEQIDKTLGADFVVQNSQLHAVPRRRSPTRCAARKGAGLVVRQRFAPLAVRLPDGKRVETTAAGYEAQLDDVAHITYAQGDTAAALARREASPWTRRSPRSTTCASAALMPVEFPGGRTDRADGRGAHRPGRRRRVRHVRAGCSSGSGRWRSTCPAARTPALYVNAAPGTSADVLRARLEKTLDPYPQVQVRDLADYKKLVHDQIAVLLYLVYALLGLAIVIAVLGVVNTLALSVVERTREIGLLRAIGLSRRQLRRMIRLESVVIAVFGAVLGLALGARVGRSAIQQVLALQGMEALAIPWGDDRRGRGRLGRRGASWRRCFRRCVPRA